MARKPRAKDKIDTDQPITAKDLLDLREAAAPALRAMVDAAVVLAGARDTATQKGVDWSQFKALLKAEILDADDNGERVAKILKKADRANAYADMLGMTRENHVSPAFDPSTGEIREAAE
jgi:hypothetical protein